MIIENNDITEQIDCDICIVGGGPAAISLAIALKDTEKKIIMLTGGGWKETVFNQDLHKGIIAEGSSHEPLEEFRRRQFGGGSTAWGGRCIPFEPIDFIKRDWVNKSGWPFTYNDLLPYYKAASVLTKTGEFKFTISDDEKQREIIKGMDSEYLTSTHIERWSPPVNFALEFKTLLSDSENITVYIDAHALKFCTDKEPDNISHAEVYMQGKRFKVSASRFILAAGGLENPRLLLASANTNHPGGIGNKHDNLGRYYMAHIAGNYAEFSLNEPLAAVTSFERDSEGIYFRRRWWITDKAQSENKLMNIVFMLDNPNDEYGHMEAHLSAIIAAKAIRSVIRQKSFKAAVKRFKEITPSLRKHIFNIMIRGWLQTPDVALKALKRIPRRRLPVFLPRRSSRHWSIFFQAEQTPCRDSRVIILNNEQDPLGVPRLMVDVKVNHEDIESIVKSFNMLVSHFKKSNAGSINYSEEGLRKFLDDKIKNFTSVAHHIGATRMAASEHDGVVDENSKVHGIKNLFVTGSSVFPTGSHVNPTLTIIALSLRLAEHLKKQNGAK